MGIVGWDSVKKSTKEGSGSRSGELFLKLSEGKHKIRLIGRPHEIYLCWINKKKFLVPEKYISRLEHLGFKPRLHYAINVFDRSDTENGVYRVKILEKGTQLFQFFSTYYNELEVDPGGKKGPDWRIIVECPTTDKRQTTYSALAVGEKPFTKEEIDLITRPKTMSEDELKKLPLGERGLIDLVKFYNEENAAKQLDEMLAKASGTASDSDDVDGISGEGGDGESLDSLLGGDEGTTAKTASSKSDDSNDNDDDSDDLDLDNIF